MKHGYFIHNCFQLISYMCLAAFLLIVKYSSFKKNHVVSFTTFCSTRSQNIELLFVILLTDTTAKTPFSLSKDSLECQSFSLVVPLLHLHCKTKLYLQKINYCSHYNLINVEFTSNFINKL